MTTTAKHLLSEIVAGLDGVTPGIWGACHHLKSPEHDASCPCGYRGGIWSGDGEYLVVEMGSSPDVDETGQVQGHITPQADRATQLADAAHIIRCSPDRIRAIAAYVEQLEKALEPFVNDWADEDGWTDHACQRDRIVDWFGPSDFRRARAALGGSNE